MVSLATLYGEPGDELAAKKPGNLEPVDGSQTIGCAQDRLARERLV